MDFVLLSDKAERSNKAALVVRPLHSESPVARHGECYGDVTPTTTCATLPMSLVSTSKPPYGRSVKLTTKVADSLILAVFNVVLVASGFLLLTTSYAILFIAVLWGALPFSLLFTLGFWVRDIRGAFRRQAKIALLVSLPVLLFEIWLLGFHKLDL